MLRQFKHAAKPPIRVHLLELRSNASFSFAACTFYAADRSCCHAC
jgi:hypothetical protein